jgi:predicted transcriptional regulator
MAKVGKLVPPDKMAIAEKNGIPRTTLYNRIRAGWDIDEAISKPSSSVAKKKQRNEEGIFVGVGKGKTRGFSVKEEWEEELDKAIAESGLTQSEWVEQTVISKLKQLKAKKGRRSK